MNYDYIIVGAGIGGLSAGLNLAFNNKKVLILEKNSLPGGVVTTFKRGRFEFDVALYDLLNYGNDKHIGSLKRLFKKFDLQIDTLPINYNIRINSIDEKYDDVIKGEIDDWVLKLEELHSGSMAAFRGMLPILKEIHEGLKALKKGRTDIEKNFPNLIKYLDVSTVDALKDLGIPFDTINILGHCWVDIGSPLNKLNFIDFAEYMYKFIFKRPVALYEKNISLVLKLAKRYQELGGKIYYRACVKEINDVDNKKEIVLTDGTKYYTKEVICNLSERFAYKNLISTSNLNAYQKENARTLSMNGVVVYLGLNKSYQDLKLYNYRYYKFQTLNSKNNIKYMSNLNHHTWQAIVPNIVNNDASPKNTTILILKTLYTKDAWNEVNKFNYYEMKEKIANNLIEEFEETFGIDIKEYIEEMEIATPITFSKYVNSINGSLFGPMRLGYDNSINRLLSYDEEKMPSISFVGGASIFGNGVDNAFYSGYFVTEKLLEEERRDYNG